MLDQKCLPNGIMDTVVDVFTFSIDGSYLVLTPNEALQYLLDIVKSGDNSEYTVQCKQMTYKEFSELPEFEGF